MKKRGNTRSQVSLEFLLVVGFAFLMTIPLIILFYKQSESINTEVTASQIDKVASEIRDAADEVYYLGSPSKKTITVYIPEDVKAIRLVDDTTEIVFVAGSAGKEYDIVKWIAGNLTSSSISPNKGIHHIYAEAIGDKVKIRDD
jgi:uncharacterized protein (UPF0333 family)